MKIVIDMQGAQAASRYRGIGKYTDALARALVEATNGKGIYLALNAAFAPQMAEIRGEYEGILSPEQFLAWHPDLPIAGWEHDSVNNRLHAENRYEACLLSVMPDAILIPSIFESYDYCNNAVTAIRAMKGKTLVAAVLHDLIPLLYPDEYLHEPTVKAWYEEKLQHLIQADLLIAISESARQEGIGNLMFPPEKIITISSAVPKSFAPSLPKDKGKVLDSLGIAKPFLLYTAGREERKNVRGLIQGFSYLPEKLRRKYQLVVVFDLTEAIRFSLTDWAEECGLAPGELILTDFVDDETLFKLYNLCTLFVFPSFHEGFGLPVLEAMACGKPVVASNTSSMPEVVGREDALFDPSSAKDMATCIAGVLSDPVRYEALRSHALHQSAKFSWEKSAQALLSLLRESATGIRTVDTN